METTCQIPRKFTAGDTISWVEEWSEYPASLFSLTLTLISQTGKISVSAMAADDGHSFTLDTASLSAGRHDYQLVATGNGFRSTIDRGYVDVLPDLAAADTYDGRSHVKKMLDALEAALEGRADKTQLVQKFDGTEVQYMDHDQLVSLRDKYKEKHFAELVRQGKKKLLQPIGPRFLS